MNPAHSFLVILPLLLPLFLMILHLALGVALREADERTAARFHLLNTLGTTLSLGAATWLWSEAWSAGPLVARVGSWPAPFGIVLVADLFSASMVWITSFVGLMVALYLMSEDCNRGDRAPDDPRNENRTRPGYFMAYQALLTGVTGSFLTGDLFNLFVWFEVMLMASFVLVAFEGKRAQIEGAVKYTALNLLSSFFFLGGIAMLYGAAGTLNFADLATKIAADSSFPVRAGFALLLVAFGTKAGLFPLFFWLPAAYPTPRIATSALLAGLLTKVGVYALIRIYTLIFSETLDFSRDLLIGVSLLTMLTGVLGAAAYYEVRRILSFHIISQIGYMTLGLAFFTPAALSASFFYIFHHIVVKTNLFLIGGVIERVRGSSDLKRNGGLYRSHPFLAFLFLIPALSLSGMPPLSGFFAKFSLIRAGLLTESWVPVGVALFVGLLTLFSMTKIWIEAFWKPYPSRGAVLDGKIPVGMLIPIVLMAAVTVAFGFYPPLLLTPAERMATELLDPSVYIEAVMDGERGAR